MVIQIKDHLEWETYGSRSLAVGGTAIVKACDKIIEKGRKVAAKMLEAKPEEVDFKAGRIYSLRIQIKRKQ